MYNRKTKTLKKSRLETTRKYKTFKLPIQLKGTKNYIQIHCILNVCFLIMSVVIVKASAITIYQNQTTVTATTADDQVVSSSNNNLSPFQATTSDFINTNPLAKNLNSNYNPQLPKDNLTITNHIIRTNIIVGGGIGGGGSGDSTEGILKENLNKPTENMRAKLQQLLQRENNDDDEEKQQLQQDLQQQQQMQEQLQQQQQQQQQYQTQHAILTGENAYLLERIDGGSAGAGVGIGGSVHEKPIYGTWNAKARRPPAPLLTATASATSTTTTTASAILQPSASMQTLFAEVDENFYGRQQPVNHHYERLPRRSSTMTPVRRELNDQIPRPPRLTSRQPSVALRRQFSETPLPNGLFRDESRPKPFHYPFDGPLPEEFKKLQPGERAVANGMEHDSQVHNIQDILQKLNLGPAASKVPPLMMMPTGLHISGSFKNLKSSGLGNFFRGKRHKKQIQMQYPMTIPMHMIPNPYQSTSVMNFMPQPYQQRIAMEQFYPFKPRSPGDINLLAMQQQQQQSFNNPHSKSKKQKKKQKEKKNSLASSNLMMHQYPFVTAAPEVLFPSMYPPLMSINVTQVPPLQMAKRVPFKVNLDIFPVLPPSKKYKSPGGYSMDEARILPTMRSPTALRNPYMDFLTTPITPTTAAALNFFNPYNPKNSLYNPIRFPTAGANTNPLVSVAPSSNMQMVYPDQMQKYLQQQQQQQQQHQQNLFSNFLNSQGHQTPFLPIDCDQPIPSAASSSQSSPGNSKTNPIMVHLNVFPKQKSTNSAPSPISTNPFYSNVPNVQRNTIQEEGESSLSAIEPRHQGRSLNDTAHTKIARSDSNEDLQQLQPLQRVEDLVDFEHPIVAEVPDGTDELPQPEALTGGKQLLGPESSSSSFYYESRPNTTSSSKLLNNNNIVNSNTNYNGNSHDNMEQMVSEARTASLFRFPVEDLIQFQVHDAM